MDTAEEGPFNQSQHPWYRPRTIALPLPLLAYRGGKLTIDATELSGNCKIGELPLSCSLSLFLSLGYSLLLFLFDMSLLRCYRIE